MSTDGMSIARTLRAQADAIEAANPGLTPMHPLFAQVTRLRDKAKIHEEGARRSAER